MSLFQFAARFGQRRSAGYIRALFEWQRSIENARAFRR